MPRPKAGYVNKAGTKIPGVTTITGRFKESGALLFWAFEQGKNGAATLYEKRDEAADVGTFVHAMWESLLRDSKAPEWPSGFDDEMKAQATRSLDAAMRWKEDTGLVVKPYEEPIVSEAYQYGGTPDSLITSKRGGGLGDWKSSKGIYLDTWIQMAAYLQLLEENKLADTSDGAHIVRFGKNGEFSHTHIPREHPALALAFGQFLRFADAYLDDKKLKKLVG